MEGKLLPIKAFSLDIYEGETPKKEVHWKHVVIIVIKSLPSGTSGLILSMNAINN